MVKIDKASVLRKIRNIVISFVVLLVVIVGGGVGYTWYVGQNESANITTESVPEVVTPAPVIKPIKPAANANVSASVQMLTSPVAPGDNASITVKTNAESECTIAVEYNDIPSADSGLKPKKADDFGVVSWTWTIEETVPLGKWPVEVNCAYNEKSAMVRGELVVETEK